MKPQQPVARLGVMSRAALQQILEDAGGRGGRGQLREIGKRARASCSVGPDHFEVEVDKVGGMFDLFNRQRTMARRYVARSVGVVTTAR